MAKSRAGGGGTSLIPAVGYLRRSSDSESQAESIPEQRTAVEQLAAERGYKIIRWYIDDAVSGDDTRRRRAFRQMIADARELGDFEAILCWDQARFGRFDSIEYGYYVFPLREAGVVLVTVTDGVIDWNDETMRIVGNVTQEGRHKFLRDLSANVTRGQLAAANNGGWLGKPPYGYRLDGPRKARRLIPGDPAHVRVVQRVFREFVHDGRSMAEIADRLNADGYPPPNHKPGGRWRYDTVGVILANPAYAGDFTAGKYAYGKYHSIKAGRVARSEGPTRNPEAQWIVIRDHHEPMVDRPTWEAAQRLLARTKTGRKPYKPDENPYILANVLRCGRCGGPMWGDVLRGKARKRRHRYYECGNHNKNGDTHCPGTRVREDKVLYSVADHLDQEFLDLDGRTLARAASRGELISPSDLPRAFAKVKALVSPPRRPVADRKRAEKQAKELDERIDKARRNLVHLDKEFIPGAQDEIRRLQAERDELEMELRKKPPTADDVNAEALAVLRCLYWLAVYFRAAADEALDRAMYGDDEELWPEPPGGGDARLLGCGRSPEVRRHLHKLAGITVFTRIEGTGRRTRHVFERGEIALPSVGADTEKVNLHRRVQSPPAYR